MAASETLKWLTVDRREVIHAVRTAIAAVASLFIGHLVRLPEAYWAVIATMIVMQSTLGAAWAVSKDRLMGTALGAASGAVLAAYAGQNILAFGVGVFMLGVICAALRIDQSAYRYAGITLVIVMLVARTQPPWIIALHRSAEMAIGIGVGLILTATWPESAPMAD